MLLFVLAVVTLLFYVIAAIELVRGSPLIANLEDIPPLDSAVPPKVSIIVAACNEERGIEQALASVLQQDYPDYEVIVVNDRSIDGTGRILERMAALNSLLRIVTVDRLPEGWLGKNHALQKGASEASGSILVFTDADVVMDPSVVSRAVRYTLDHGIDHLAIPPACVMPGFALNAFLGTFALIFNLYMQPWKARDPKSSKHIGIGAFNLVRTEVYRAVGRHQPIAMRPDDDVKLGKLIKLRGYKQDMVVGTALLSVEWYATFGELVEGLMKNMFAGVEYSVPAAIGACVAQALFSVWPFVAVVFTRGWVQLLNGVIAAGILILFAANGSRVGIRKVYAFTYPIGILVFCYILLRSMTITLWTGGINWRGTHYPLAQLRANKI